MSSHHELIEYTKYIANTAWARFGLLSELIGKRIPCKGRPILLISMPRSGSSWTAKIISQSTDLLYLDEPVTQSVLKYGITPARFHIKKGGHPPKVFEKIFDKSFRGIPSFEKKITNASDWSLLKRSNKRLFIKEVTPFLCHYYIDNYDPQIILLLRHPAGIVSSFLSLWAKSDYKTYIFDVSVLQASATRAAFMNIKNTTDYIVIKYEELCASPVEMFKMVFNFLKLDWNNDVDKFLKNTMNPVESESNHNIFRDTQKIVYAWKNRLSIQQLEQIKKVYFEYDLPWYRDESEWEIE